MIKKFFKELKIDFSEIFLSTIIMIALSLFIYQIVSFIEKVGILEALETFVMAFITLIGFTILGIVVLIIFKLILKKYENRRN